MEKLDEVRALPSCIDVLLRVDVGDPLIPTVDYLSSPGVVFLAHPDRAVIERDRERIRVIEIGGLFTPL